jgi:hypothetical protein
MQLEYAPFALLDSTYTISTDWPVLQWHMNLTVCL